MFDRLCASVLLEQATNAKQCSKLKKIKHLINLSNKEYEHRGGFIPFLCLFSFIYSDACMFSKVTSVMGIKMEHRQTQS